MTTSSSTLRRLSPAKPPDTALPFFPDGLTWKQRKTDLRKIVGYQTGRRHHTASTPTRWRTRSRPTSCSLNSNMGCNGKAETNQKPYFSSRRRNASFAAFHDSGNLISYTIHISRSMGLNLPSRLVSGGQ